MILTGPLTPATHTQDTQDTQGLMPHACRLPPPSLVCTLYQPITAYYPSLCDHHPIITIHYELITHPPLTPHPHQATKRPVHPHTR